MAAYTFVPAEILIFLPSFLFWAIIIIVALIFFSPFSQRREEKSPRAEKQKQKAFSRDLCKDRKGKEEEESGAGILVPC